MESNPTRAGPSPCGNPRSNLANGNDAIRQVAPESAGVCSQRRSATSGGEGAR